MNKLLIPEEYKRIDDEFPDMGFPCKEGEIYGLRADMFSAFILKCIVPENVSMNFDYPQIVIDDWHNNMPDNYGLIEVKNGITNSGNKFIYFIIKHRINAENDIPMANGYMLNMNIKIDDDIYFINSSFKEEGITGHRDAVIYMIFRQKYSYLEDSFDGWMADPYDKDYNKGFLMNISEEEQFDEMFPEHPLSKARSLAKYIIDNN